MNDLWRLRITDTEDKAILPYSLKDAPALIEKLLPVQKLSAEAYKEQMAGSGKTLTALGSYWKGRKPLILAKACVLGCLLPTTDDLKRDLDIFEKLMAMDDASMAKRLRLKSGKLPQRPYREQIAQAKRPEELTDSIHDHIWDDVNEHLRTDAHSFPELVEQLGIMRFGHRPRVADTFCGSGQIPFEAARLGCDVYASDLNPVACMLTWGAFNIVGGSRESREALAKDQQALVERVQTEIDRLGVETDGNGWRGKVYLYCVEVECPQTGWMVPLLPTRVVSKGHCVIAELIPDAERKRYDIAIHCGVTDNELREAEQGTVRSDGRGQDPYLIHTVDGREYRTKISTLRGDYRKDDGSTGNQLRLWEKQDFKPRPEDLFQERLYCIQWMRPRQKGKGDEYQFRAVTKDDLKRERIVEDFIAQHLGEWQKKGWIPDMRIEQGDETERLYRERGWTHWHHLFMPRHLLSLGLIRSFLPDAKNAVLFGGVLDFSSKLCRWTTSKTRVAKDGSGKQVGGASNGAANVFYNQALNTFFNFGCRATSQLLTVFFKNLKNYPLEGLSKVECQSAPDTEIENDLYITDPPYGDAVNYHEILEFFIAWLRKNPPAEFADWIWDSRRSLAIKGEGEDFRRGMVAAYRRMAEQMPDNGIQIIMFTHQSGSIWADMANIVWASGLQVTAAWYVATETDSALREGSYVKGTVLLVVRKQAGSLKTTRDDLAWEIQEEVEEQVKTLTGLNQEAKGLYRDENLFEDVDLQIAGYAAALRALTRYASIDGKDMAQEAIRPRVKGQKTLVDELIEFAVGVANQCLVPRGIEKAYWDKLVPAERFYLKLIDMESRGASTLDNYQNFAKAFKVKNFRALMASQRANAARLKSPEEFGRAEMAEGSELYNTTLRGVLYALMELAKDKDGHEVLAHLAFNVPNYYDGFERHSIVELASYLAEKLDAIRPKEASAARVLRDLVRHQQL